MARTEPELTDDQWAALEPLLPPQRPATGRPNNGHRQVVEAMIWLARTGALAGPVQRRRLLEDDRQPLLPLAP